jgi:long-chain acyl-CoA synthetase
MPQAPQPPARASVVELLGEFVVRTQPYLIYDNGYRHWSYSYAQVAGAAYRFAARLAASGLGRGDKVLIWSESRPEWIVAFWGCALLGIVVVPVDARSSAEFAARVARIAEVRLVLAGDSVAATDFAGVFAGAPVWPLRSLDWAPHPPVPAAAAGPDDILEIVFTSGATGDPKGVLITHRNVLANLSGPERVMRRFDRYIRHLPTLRFLNLIPLSHMFGQMMALFILPVLPGAVVLTQTTLPEEIVRQARRHRVTALIAVPKILDLLGDYIVRRYPAAARPGRGRWWWRWLQYHEVHSAFGWQFWALIVGGAALPRETEEFWNKLGLPVIQGYGLTETAPIVTLNHPFAIRRGSVGRPVAGTEVRIAPDGEILVRGPNVTPGYFGAPAGASEAFEDGWLHTGDIGELDAEGNLIIHGRKKEMIVLPDGRNVFPEDVESVLESLPGVREAAVVGPDSVRAVLVVEPGADPEAIVRQANQRLEDHQRIRQVAVWPQPALPRTETTRKLKHAVIQRWLDEGGPAPAAPSEDSVAAILSRYAPGRKLDATTTLEELGLSSLDRVELAAELEQRLGTSLDEALLASGASIAALEGAAQAPPAEPTPFPTWARRRWARWLRRCALAPLLLPLTRLFAHIHVSGREHLRGLAGPVLFAANHQSHMDVPVILAALPARLRHRTATAMAKEFFAAHFHPDRYRLREWLPNRILYLLAAALFHGFPLPQQEARAGEALRYMGELVGEGWNLLLFPEGRRTDSGELHPFRPGVGFVAARLGIPVVPVRIAGLHRVLGRDARFPRRGRVEVAFGAPLRIADEDFAAFAARVREAVAKLLPPEGE